MQALPPDFPEQITFTYLFNKSWEIYKGQFVQITSISLVYLLIALPLALLPFIGGIFSHILYFGVIYSMNNFRINGLLHKKDIFWGFSNFKRFKQIFILTIINFPLIIILAIFYFFNISISSEIRVPLYTFGICLFIYFFLISMISTFIYIIEQESPTKTINRSILLLGENLIDLTIVFVWILIMNLAGLFTVIGIFFTAPLSALIMLELTRFLIRKYELRSLTIQS